MVKHLLRNVAAALMIMAAGLLGTQNLFAQNHAIRGSVIDAAGQPVIGAAVVVVGNKTLGVVTGPDGTFSMSVPTGATLNVSCIGYKTQIFPAGNQTNFRFVLEEDNQLLEETVVIGYGVQKKSDLTGSVASVRSEDLLNRSTSDAASALQGKASGVQVLNYSGAPGQGASIRVRGYSSNSGSIGPLLIVDGVQVGSIQYLDPSMIESMEILKDAASAAIYGAQAGNGVVLITTKTGASNNGMAKVSYDFKLTRQSLGRKANIFNAEDFIAYKKASGIDIDSMLEAKGYDGTDTDWFDAVFAPSWSQQHSVTFQGGNNRGHYLTSLNFLNNDGIVRGDKDVYKRLTAQVNADYKLFDWLTVGSTNSIEKWSTHSVSQMSAYGGLFYSALTLDPLTPVYYSDPSQFSGAMKQAYDEKWTTGKYVDQYRWPRSAFLKDPSNGLYYATSKYQDDDNGNPLLQRDRVQSSNGGLNIRGSLYANFSPIKGLTYTSRFGYNIAQSTSHSYNTPYYATPQAKDENYSISAGANTSYYYQWENFVNYNLILGKHNITAMAGMEYTENNYDNVSASASGRDILSGYTDRFLYLNYVKKTVDSGYIKDSTQSPDMSTSLSISNAPGKSASISYFGRLNYSYDDRYSFQSNFRYDAFDSSKLSATNRWGFFPSFSAGWTISNENFVKDNISRDALSFLKLRASWGRNGNVNVLGGYSYDSTISYNGSWYQYSATDPTQTFGSAPSGLVNDKLNWEVSEQLDLGLDARFLRNRLTVGIDYYDKRTKDLLISITPPIEIGVSSTVANSGSVMNRGIELEASWKDNIGDLYYNISGNFSALKNKVTYLDPSIPRITGSQGGVSGTNNPIYTAFEVGYPIWYFRGYKYDGVNPDTGDAIIEDVTGDGAIDSGDMTYIGKAIPDFTYGLTVNLSYKGFDFSMFGTGVYGNNIFTLFYRADTPMRNSLRYFYDNAWSATNKGGTMPDPSKVVNDWHFWGSSASMFDGSFFKIKQLQLGYTIPQNLTKKVNISNLRFYVSLDDFFTFSKYPGFDPETATTTSSSGMGFDAGTYPTTRKVVLGVNLTF